MDIQLPDKEKEKDEQSEDEDTDDIINAQVWQWYAMIGRGCVLFLLIIGPKKKQIKKNKNQMMEDLATSLKIFHE